MTRAMGRTDVIRTDEDQRKNRQQNEPNIQALRWTTMGRELAVEDNDKPLRIRQIDSDVGEEMSKSALEGPDVACILDVTACVLIWETAIDELEATDARAVVVLHQCRHRVC